MDGSSHNAYKVEGSQVPRQLKLLKSILYQAEHITRVNFHISFFRMGSLFPFSQKKITLKNYFVKWLRGETLFGCRTKF